MEPIFKKNLVIDDVGLIDPSDLPRKTLTRLHRNGIIKCCDCGIMATHVARWKHVNEILTKGWHVDYFAQRPTGTMVMMTKDHILPVSLGGRDHITNLRAMCERCNANRGNNVTNREIIAICARLNRHTSKRSARKVGFNRSTGKHHPLAGWHAIFQKFPQLENAVRFQ